MTRNAPVERRVQNRVLRIAAGSLVLVILLLGGLTLAALEWSDVAILETRSPEGGVRETRVWYVRDEEGRLLVEAGTAESPWLADVREHPVLRFKAGSEDLRGEYGVSVRANPAGHQEIRRRLRAKYGLRDAWIACLFDVETSVEVELVPGPA